MTSLKEFGHGAAHVNPIFGDGVDTTDIWVMPDGSPGVTQVCVLAGPATSQTDWSTIGPYQEIGLFSRISYERNVAFDPGCDGPETSGIVGYAIMDSSAGGTIIGVTGSVLRKPSTGQAATYGLFGSAQWDGTDAATASRSVGMCAQSWMKGAGSVNENIAGEFATLQTAGSATNAYGVYIHATQGGTSRSFNLWSDGAASKNMFQGRVFVGVPNSAPTDGDLLASTVSAYLDEGANKLKFRVRYAGGTYKTGEVALV